VGTAKEGSKRKPFMPHLTLQEFNPEQKVLTVELSDDQLLSEEQTNQSGGAQKPILPLKNKVASPKQQSPPPIKREEVEPLEIKGCPSALDPTRVVLYREENRKITLKPGGTKFGLFTLEISRCRTRFLILAIKNSVCDPLNSRIKHLNSVPMV